MKTLEEDDFYLENKANWSRIAAPPEAVKPEAAKPAVSAKVTSTKQKAK